MKHNFSAGPSILPVSTLKGSADAILNFNNSGLSILEISHRSKDFEAVLHRAVALVKEMLNIGDNHEVLFLSGGASSQFFMVPYNLLGEGMTAGYINTGTWSKKAIKEAKLLGNIEVVASSESTNFDRIPKDYQVKPEYRYLHYTSNNTIFGTQFHEIPNVSIPLVCDMSSDIFSKKIDIEKYDLIYAGAQKNLGPAGVTLVIIRKDICGKIDRVIPSMIDYRNHIENNSMYNTPPVLPIYASMLTLEWLKEMGGVEKIAELNDQKAQLLYSVIDKSEIYSGHALKEDRSKMNVCFRLPNEQLESEFLKFCDQEGCVGLKGHRSVGGIRASIYNAMPADSVQCLAEIMIHFEKTKS